MKWEYQIAYASFDGINDSVEPLNRLGDDGWEAVGVWKEPHVYGHRSDHPPGVLMKRRKEST